MAIQTNALSDYQRWKKANSDTNFSIFDYLHCSALDKKIPVDFCIALFELFYPEFILIDNHVFLKEEYERDKYLELVKQNCTKKDVEYWMNLLNIDALFYREEIEDKDSFENALFFICEQIVDLWSQKLHKEFSDRQFFVNYIRDDGEMYIVFYEQT